MEVCRAGRGEVPTQPRTARRRGSSPRGARRSPNAAPHGPPPWKFAALGRAKPTAERRMSGITELDRSATKRMRAGAR